MRFEEKNYHQNYHCLRLFKINIYLKNIVAKVQCRPMEAFITGFVIKEVKLESSI